MGCSTAAARDLGIAIQLVGPTVQFNYARGRRSRRSTSITSGNAIQLTLLTVFHIEEHIKQNIDGMCNGFSVVCGHRSTRILMDIR